MIFISHAERDEASAAALVDFLMESIDIPADRIQRTGSPTDGDYARMRRRLKERVGDSSVVIALVPPDSLSCGWVIFELGAAWAMDKLLVLFFMPGIDFRDMPEPLSNYPSVDISCKDAHITIMDIARDVADFLGLPERKNGSTFAALERLIDTMRGTAEAYREKDTEMDYKPDKQETQSKDQLPLRFDFAALDGDIASDGDEYCDVVCSYEVLAKGGAQPQRIVVRASLDDIFKSFASHLERPQEDEYIRKIILEFCKGKNATFFENCRYGVFRRPSVEMASYRQIMRRFASLGYIDQARAPHSAFQKQSRRTYWAITEKGEEFLSRTLVVHKALQEWFYREKHVPRSAIRKVSPPNFD